VGCREQLIEEGLRRTREEREKKLESEKKKRHIMNYIKGLQQRKKGPIHGGGKGGGLSGRKGERVGEKGEKRAARRSLRIKSGPDSFLLKSNASMIRR